MEVRLQHQTLPRIIHEPFRGACSVQRKGDEYLEKLAYVGHYGLQALEIALLLFMNETHSRE